MIDSSAYPLLWTIISEVEVMIVGEFIEEKGMARFVRKLWQPTGFRHDRTPRGH